MPQVLILGPAASGKRTIGKMVAAKLHVPHLNKQNLVEDAELALRNEAQGYTKQNKVPVYVTRFISKVSLLKGTLNSHKMKNLKSPIFALCSLV